MNAVELAIVPLDAARRATLRLATRSPFVTRVLGRRDSRIAWLASAQVCVLFVLALVAPAALFLIGPVLLGVIHLGADVRYLVLRRGTPRTVVLVSAVTAVAMTAVQVASRLALWPPHAGEVTSVLLGVAWTAAALVVALRDRPLVRVGAVAITVAVGAFLVTHARFVSLTLVHAHNVVAVGVWLVAFRKNRRWAAPALALVVVFGAILLSGVAVPWIAGHEGFSAFGMRSGRFAAWLAPGLHGNAALALATTFVFLQGVHYAAWTTWIPQDTLGGEGSPTFRMTLRGLTRDFGPVALSLVALVAVAFAGLALWNIRASVGWYMTLATWHAWLEIAFLAYLVAARRTAAARP